jgi:stage V sporulation protein R
MEFERLRRSYAYGLHKIYEMVINNDPSYAYLLEHNKLVDHKLVMAHVYAHSDFFKNNLWFSHTNRRMLDEMANHGTRVRRYADRFGAEEVERFLDVCLSIDDLIDPNAAFDETLRIAFDEEPTEPIQATRFQTKDYMDRFVNPHEVLEAERSRREQEREQGQRKFPSQPQRDVLYFLLTNAPLKTWQADVLAMMREESYYFLPQRQTKIMNEGWAAYWHSKIMTESGVLEPAEVVDYADHHSGTMAISPNQLNPYKLGALATNGTNAPTWPSGVPGTNTSGWGAKRSSRSAGSTTTWGSSTLSLPKTSWSRRSSSRSRKKRKTAERCTPLPAASLTR